MSTIYKKLTYIITFFIGFIFSFIIVSYSFKQSNIRAIYSFASHFSKDLFDLYKSQQLSFSTLKNIVFGEPSNIVISGSKENILDFLNILNICSTENKSNCDSHIGVWIKGKFIINANLIFIDKIVTQGLINNPHLLNGISFSIERDHRNKMPNIDLEESCLLFQNLKFYYNSASILGQTPLDQFFQDISSAYLYNQYAPISINILSYKKEGFSYNQQYAFIYFAFIQSVLIIPIKEATFHNLLIKDPVGLILCFIVGIVLALSVHYFLYRKKLNN